MEQAQLQAVRERHQREAAAAAPRKEIRGGYGYCRRSIPSAAYFNALNNHGVDPNDEGYWNDMERLYPEIVVPLEDGARPRMAVRPARVTRFGVVSFRKVYGKDGARVTIGAEK
jgi:hypothetical protein